MTSEFSKYLNEQLGVFFNVKQQKGSLLKTRRREFLGKNVFVCCNYLSNTYAIQVFENLLRSPLIRNCFSKTQ